MWKSLFDTHFHALLNLRYLIDSQIHECSKNIKRTNTSMLLKKLLTKFRRIPVQILTEGHKKLKTTFPCCFDATKGQLISECPFEILDFPKIPRKI